MILLSILCIIMVSFEHWDSGYYSDVKILYK